MITVRRCSVADIEAAPDLVRAYEAESGMSDLGQYQPNWVQYRAMEDAGWFTCIGAFRGEQLVGMVTLLCGPNPHVGAITASTESFYVMPEERKHGAGLALLAQAEAIATEKGASGLFVSARPGSTLAKVLRTMHSYKPSNEVFCKVLV